MLESTQCKSKPNTVTPGGVQKSFGAWNNRDSVKFLNAPSIEIVFLRPLLGIYPDFLNL